MGKEGPGIARELTQAGYHTKSGGTDWNTSHIVKLLRNEKYVGDLIQKKSILDRVTVFQDRHMELRLTELPHTFHFR